jgi:hypothetical protein
MTSPAAELQKAVFAALANDVALLGALGGAKIYDDAPAHAGFPYITFGLTSVYDWSTSTETGTEQLFTLHVWSKAHGKAEALKIMEAARAVLDDAALTLDGHHLVSLRFDFADVRFEDDLIVYHGLLRFRALTEAAE